MLEHKGQLLPTEGQATAVNIAYGQNNSVEKVQILDICSFVGEYEYMLRIVPTGCMGSEGVAGTNFYAGNCNRSTKKNGHYVFFIDSEGNVYTGCDCNENGRIEEDGMENVSTFSGNCPDDSEAGCEIWP